jgi:hypothetical protein
MLNFKYHFLFLLIFYNTRTTAGDWSGWSHSTPKGNFISKTSTKDSDRILFFCQKSQSTLIQFMDSWYFYKGHVIGTLEFNQPYKYFVIDEEDCKLDAFQSFQEFQSFIQQKNLKPKFWTRHFHENWGFFFTGPGYGGFWDFLYFRGTWLAFPIVLLSVILLISKYRKRAMIKFICIGIICLTVILVFLDFNPQSI